MASPEEETPVLESKALADHLEGVSEDLSNLSVSHSVPRRGDEARNIPISEAIECVAGDGRDGGGDMSQSYHEIFDSQRYLGGQSRDSSSSLDTPGSVETVQVYYSEGEGRLVSVSPDSCQPPMSQYLTRKLISDTLMWQETFRNDSPSPEEQPSVGGEGSSQERPAGLETEVTAGKRGLEVLDPRLINDIEREARRLATELDCLVETLACALQSMSGLTVEHVQTYRDGVCKTCDQVDTNIRAMYQLMAKTGIDLGEFIYLI